MGENRSALSALGPLKVIFGSLSRADPGRPVKKTNNPLTGHPSALVIEQPILRLRRESSNGIILVSHKIEIVNALSFPAGPL
jgi:hypothetical protein